MGLPRNAGANDTLTMAIAIALPENPAGVLRLGIAEPLGKFQ
jgi:hypothetical protein